MHALKMQEQQHLVTRSLIIFFGYRISTALSCILKTSLLLNLNSDIYLNTHSFYIWTTTTDILCVSNNERRKVSIYLVCIHSNVFFHIYSGRKNVSYNPCILSVPCWWMYMLSLLIMLPSAILTSQESGVLGPATGLPCFITRRNSGKETLPSLLTSICLIRC